MIHKTFKSLKNTLHKHKVDIIFLTILSFVVLPGMVYAAALTFSTPTGLDFGSVNVGSYSDRTVRITNSSPSTVSGSVTVPSGFTCRSGCSYNLGSGASQNVTVRFSPTTATTYYVAGGFSSGSGTNVACWADAPAGPDCRGPNASYHYERTFEPHYFEEGDPDSLSTRYVWGGVQIGSDSDLLPQPTNFPQRNIGGYRYYTTVLSYPLPLDETAWTSDRFIICRIPS
jgi:hypothetical protein